MSVHTPGGSKMRLAPACILLVCSLGLGTASSDRTLLQTTSTSNSGVTVVTGASAPSASTGAAATSAVATGAANSPASSPAGPGISPASLSASAGGVPSKVPLVQNAIIISLDGFHSQDLAMYLQVMPNSVMAQLAASGVTYPNAYLPGPSDSFPGILAITTGNNVTATGVFYDDSYARDLYQSGSCTTLGQGTPSGMPGTECAYTEAQDFNIYSLGGIDGVGAFNGPATNVNILGTDYPYAGLNGTAVNPVALPLDAQCNPVHAYQYNKANTIFQAARAAGKTTAWIDKGPYYELVQGPNGNGVMDLYTPEISCSCGNPATGIPDTRIIDGSGVDLSKNLTAVRAYDELHVQALLNQIYGMQSSGRYAQATPNLYGMNMQSVSVGQKYAGYTSASGTFSTGLLTNLNYVDAALGRIVAALAQTNQTKNTALIVTAKHGQQPIYPNATLISPTPIATALAAQNISVAQFTTDDIGLIWLNASSQATAALAYLRTISSNSSYGILAVNPPAYYGLVSNVPGRTPDLVIVPQPGVVYASPTSKKISEHGGLMMSDENVALLVNAPNLSPGSAGSTYSNYVSVSQVACTALSFIGVPCSGLTPGYANPLPGL
ncbi:hypothetical protein WJX84_001753 [Apatococcus fuscideae]|uniref:Type I phosphodiesterase/nucleotide pyrophosphatase n=1 Tax=Apatococcus fuscideae TaxID=2026836 RepID=A0AAW1TGK9_9CHLO